ncbi:hypothetical protein [Nonomuraea sp. NPDC049695]|uniref:hypothetical protein n=1 Tax=Nonomuraea sp. NPDC049695 TaxID=3154734 RepID=UPI003418FADB
MPERPSQSPRPRGLAHQYNDLPQPAPAEHPGATSSGRHRRDPQPERTEDLSPDPVSTGRSAGRLRRAGLPAAVAVVGLVCLTLLFNPFGPRLAPTTNAAQHNPQVNLGPLPFDTSAPPIPTGQPRPTLEPVTTSSASPRTATTKPATRRPTTRPSSKPTLTPVTDDRTIVQQIGPSHGPITGPYPSPSASSSATASATSTPDVPQPLAPTASLSTSLLALGTSRSGSFNVSISPGSGTWSATDTGSIDVDADGSFTVDAPRSEAGCPGASRTAAETVTISWHGNNGATTASGTLTLTVSWEITKDKGDWIHSPNAPGGGYWSNCTPDDAAYPGAR